MSAVTEGVPLDSSLITPPKAATLAEASIAFDDVRRRVRLQLPESLSMQTVRQGGHTYAALYHKNKRVERLLVNFLYPDTVSNTVAEDKTVDIDGVTVQTLYYTAGVDTAAIGAGFSSLPLATVQLAEDLTMEYIRPYFE